MSPTYYDSEEVHDCFEFLRKKYEQQSHDGRTFVLFKSFMKEFEDKYSPWQVVDDAHAKYSNEPPDINSGVFQFNRVFYILLQLGHVDLIPFFRRINDALLPIDRNYLEELLDEHDLRERLGDKWKEVLDEFCRAQTAWCPLSFSELSIQWEERVSQSKRIVPFYRKNLIQPCGAGQRPSEDRARLYEVYIPKELVSSPELSDSDLLKESDLAPPFYRFALKQFPESLKSSYDKEVKAFRALGKQPGMVRYYGCYEAMGDNNQPSTYNMILEYADYDLNGAMVKEAPPVSPSEIKSFWESMCKLSTALCEIHHLNIFGKKYDVWHGDIKPENILRVGDDFKLADPGDSWIQRAQEGRSLPPEAEVYGGTRTYGAPEKSQLLEAVTDTKRSTILQNSDVWSLGCVLSIAATYVVLGKQGVVSYERLRQSHNHTGPNEGLRQDVFHDNQKVLEEVTDWHKYLGKAARVGDLFTAKVLDLVDNHMLVMPPEERWDAKEVSNHFGELIKKEVGVVPDNIEDFLQNLDLEAEIEEESERGIHRLDSDGAKKHFQKEQQSKASTGSGRPQFESEKRLLGTKIQPTAQRSVRRPDLLRKYGHSVPPPLPNVTVSNQSVQRLSVVTNVEPPANPLPVPEPLTVFQLRDELEERHKNMSLFGSRYKSAKGNVLNDPLMPHYEDRDIIFLVDNGSSMRKWWSEAKMVIEVLAWRVLGYDSDGIELYFTNPETKTSVSGSRSRKNDVKDVITAMNEAQPRRPVQEGQGYVTTNLYDRLAEIMPKSLLGKSKTVIILTDGFWEGMPYDEYIDRYMKESLCRLAGQDPNTLSPSRPSKTDPGARDWRDEFEATRPITLQFIAFGYKGDKGWVRMERLDDMLEKQGLPDLIDMEPSHGDAHKMLLGSLCSHWDRHEHKANRLQSVMSTSPSICGPEAPSSFATASGFPSINGVHRQQTITDDSSVPVSSNGYSSSHGQSSPSSFPPSPDNQSIYSVATSPPGATGSSHRVLLSPRNYSTFRTDDRVDRSPSPDPSQRRRFRNSVPSFGIRRQLSKGRSSPN